MNQKFQFSYLFGLCLFIGLPFLAAQKTIPLDPFSEIVLTGGMNVALKNSDKEEMMIETEGIDIEDVSIKVNGGVLKINAIKGFKNKDTEINITIYHKQLFAISAAAGSKVDKEETLQGDKLNVDASSGAKISISLNHKSLEVSSSSGAGITLSGKVESGRLTASTGGNIEGKKLEIERAYVVSSTGANIAVRAVSELQIQANSGGNVVYYGTPVKKSVKKVLAGSVVNEY